MTRSRLFSIISLTASAFVVWLYIVVQVQPNKHDILVLLTFFVSMIIWLGSLLSFAIYQLRVRRGNREIVYAHVKPSLRQGLLIASTLALLLFLQSLRVMTLWEGVLILFVAGLFEIAFRQSPGLKRVSL